jgi:hypothetical protein
MYTVMAIKGSFILLWPVLLLAVLVSLLVFLWSSKIGKSEGPSFLLITSFSLLGVTLGILTGWSRSPVVGTAITAILGLVGGFSLYLLGKKEYPRIVVSVCILILSFLLLVGTYLGGQFRRIEMASEREYEEWLLDYKRNLQDRSAKYAAQLEVWKKEGLRGIDERNKASGASK